MSDLAIRVENLSKLYKIGKAQRRHDTLRDALTDLLPRMNFMPRIQRIDTKNKKELVEISGIRGKEVSEIRGEKSISNNSWQEDTIWALKDVSFACLP